jgi:hypothetical protein
MSDVEGREIYLPIVFFFFTIFGFGCIVCGAFFCQSLARRLQEREHQLAEMANRERLLQQQHRDHSLVTHQIVEPIDVRRGMLVGMSV